MRENRARLSRNSPRNSLFLIICLIYQLRSVLRDLRFRLLGGSINHRIPNYFQSLACPRVLHNLCRSAGTNDAVASAEIAWEFILPTLRRLWSNAKTLRSAKDDLGNVIKCKEVRLWNFLCWLQCIAIYNNSLLWFFYSISRVIVIIFDGNKMEIWWYNLDLDIVRNFRFSKTRTRRKSIPSFLIDVERG